MDMREALSRGLVRSFVVDKLSLPTADSADVRSTPDTLISLAPIRLPGQIWSLAYHQPDAEQAVAGNVLLALLVTLLVTAGGMFVLLFFVWRNYRQQQAMEEVLEAQKLRHRELRQELANQQTRYEQILYNANDGMFFIDLETGNLLEVNRRAEELLGYSRGEVE